MNEGPVLILGSSPAALQAASDLADCGLEVALAEDGPFLGEECLAQEPRYLRDVRLLEVIKNPRIQVWTDTRVEHLIPGKHGCWEADLVFNPRYVDLSRCTACGECLEVCPVTIPGSDLKAIHFGGQPDCAVITKQGQSPCSAACPAGIHVQGYVALTRAGRYQEAYQLIHQALPFPSVCGRVCNHYCEGACSRADSDQPINIMALKRFVAERVYKDQDRDRVRRELAVKAAAVINRPQKVAVIGAGPAGLTAARDLVRSGYPVTVFDANSLPGGMMRVGIPPHRLDYDQLAWEIEQIQLEGVDLQLDCWVDDIPALLADGYGAVLIATGAHRSVKMDVENADHPDNWLSLDFLKQVCLGEEIDLSGRRVIVLGGGDVAMDAARSAVRLGTPEVRVVCRGMRASFNEVQEAEAEGIEIIPGRVFRRVVLGDDGIAGLECLEAQVGEIVDGRRQFSELPGTEHVIPGDLVIWALGQRPDFSFLPPGELIQKSSDRGILADPQMMTSLEGIFTAGDVRRGTTFFVVDAVGEGHKAARAISDYLEGLPARFPEQPRPVAELDPDQIRSRLEGSGQTDQPRAEAACLPVEDRAGNFSEVELTLTESQALQEAGRCLVCGPCSECLACVGVCQVGAISHYQVPSRSTQTFSGLISAAPPAGWEGQEGISLKADCPLAGSAAAYPLIKDLAPRNPLVRHQAPGEKNGKRTGLVICQCGGKISDSLDTAGLREETLSWPEVDLAVELPYSCTADGAGTIQSLIHENDLQQLVLAACSCCEKDQICYSCTYQRLRCKDSLGVYARGTQPGRIHFLNIRERCAYAHPRSKARATSAARDLIRAALAQIRHPGQYPVQQPLEQKLQAMVVGKGASADICLDRLESLAIGGILIPVISGPILRSGGRYTARLAGNDLQADCLVLAPASGAELDYLLDSLKLTGNRKLLPGTAMSRFARDLGLVICPPDLDPEVAGQGAAVQLAAWRARGRNRSGQAAVVDPARCRGCGTCLEVCGLGIPALVTDQSGSRAWIDPGLCLDCGTCAAHCPTGAIQPGSLSDQALEAVLSEVLS